MSGGIVEPLSRFEHREALRAIDAERMNNKTILLCGPPSSAVGGGPTHVRNLLASPLRERYELVHFETGSRGSESPARDEALGRKICRIIGGPFGFAWQIIRFRPEVVHLNSAMDQRAFWRDLVFLAIGKMLGRKVVYQVHGGSLGELCANRAMRHIVRTVFSMPDRLVLLASAERRELCELGVTQRVAVVPNGVDVNEYESRGERRHSGKIRRLAFMGRLIRAKGIFESMEAVRVLSREERFADICLEIAGSGPDREAISAWIRRNRMEQRIRLLGSIYGIEKIEFLRRADVFVFPTYHQEGLPYAILESLAAGTPVIATKVAGIPDVVESGLHGILINAKDAQEIVAAIRELAESEERLRSMSLNCRMRAREELGLDRLAQRFSALYESVHER